MIRNLTYILILFSIATPSMAESNFDENANPVEISASQGASNDIMTDNTTNNDSQAYSAPQAPETSELADVDAFRDMARLNPGDYQGCEDMRLNCLHGQTNNPVCDQMAVQCTHGVEASVTASSF